MDRLEEYINRLIDCISALERHINKVEGELEERRQAEIKRLEARIDELESQAALQQSVSSYRASLLREML